MKYLFLSILLFISQIIAAQQSKVNYDEHEIPTYELPKILVSNNGRKIKNSKRWEKIRRPEILHLFEHEIYGEIPVDIDISDVIVFENNGSAFNGLAKRKQIELVFKRDDLELDVDVLIYLPKDSVHVPIFVGYNFNGNHTVAKDPNIRLTESWVRDNPSLGIVHNQVTEQSRGVSANRWSIEQIIKAGYGVATIYCGDVDPDRNNFQDGIHPFSYKLGQFRPGYSEWGSISAWAWGLSKVMDYFMTDSDIDSTKVIVLGHSRLGKAALWAAALDQRFAMCISNNSGCLGAALSRRRIGETVGTISSNFPHWFCENLNKYSSHEDELPIDQHMLLALIAPRPLYVTSATEDLWSDPRGEFLSTYEVGKVYELYEKQGLPENTMPDPETPVLSGVAYHIRTGKHDITDYDWKQFIHFANIQFFSKE